MMMWPLPLPNMTDLSGVLRQRLLRRNKETLRKIPGYQSTLWFMGGAEALSYICCHIASKQKKSVKLLLPSYFCGQSLRFLRNDGVDFDFYRLNDDLTPSFDSAKSLIDPQKRNLFLHVHYFDHFIDAQDSADFCRRHGCLLIEDCAHIISPFVGVDFVGEFVLFAPHKQIPVTCGGLLFARSELPVLTTLKQQISISWYLKRLIQRYLTGNKSWQRSQEWEIVWSGDKQPAQYSLPSPLEVEMLVKQLNRPQVLIDARRSNASKIATLIEAEDSPQLIRNFNQCDVPYVVGLKFTELSNLNKFAKALNQSGCPYMMWPDLPLELAVADADIQADLDRTMLTIFLFVHEEIDIHRYTLGIKKALDATK